MKKRVLSGFIAIFCGLWLIGQNCAEAADNGPTIRASGGNLGVGDYVILGSFSGEDLVWQVIGEEKGKFLLYCTFIPLEGQYDASLFKVSTGNVTKHYLIGSNSWRYSDVRTYLNSESTTVIYSNEVFDYGDELISISYGENSDPDYASLPGFLSSQNFSNQELDIIYPVTHETLIDSTDPLAESGYRYPLADTFSNWEQVETQYSSYQRAESTDKVFLLNVQEFQQYIIGQGQIDDSEFTGSYWLRDCVAKSAGRAYTSYGIDSLSINYRTYGFELDSKEADSIAGIRPACWIALSANQFLTGNGTPENPYRLGGLNTADRPAAVYIYDEVDSGKEMDFVGTLDDVADETSAMDAVDKALTEVTDEQKQSVTGIDKLTLLAEEAAAKANTVSVDSGVINVTPEDIPATADSALTATTGVLSDAGVNMQRNPRAIVNYDAGSSETVSVTTESLPETVDKVRVTTDYAMATVDAQQASSFTMSDRGNQTIEVNFDTDYETVVTVSFPGMSANDTYKAVVDAEGKPVGGKYNPATGTLEAKLTESGVYRVVNNEADFTDIKSKSQEMQDAIKELASKGIINGTTETTYAPDDTISRAEVTALLMRTLSLLNPNANGNFADVTSANWYCGAAGSAKEHNIINGFEDNTFRGDAVIAKDQIVAVSSRTLREQMDYKTPSDVNGELSVYSDAGSIANWAREDVALATVTNLVLKRTDGKFGGSVGMTRGDAAIIIKRLFDKMW